MKAASAPAAGQHLPGERAALDRQARQPRREIEVGVRDATTSSSRRAPRGRRGSRGCRSARRGDRGRRRPPARSRPPRGSRAAGARAIARPRGRSRETAPDRRRRRASARRARANASRTVGVPGGGAERASSSSAARTASTRRHPSATCQSASLRSSIASSGRVPSSSQPSSRGMKLPCERRVDLVLAAQPPGEMRRGRGLDEDAPPVGELDAVPVGRRIAAGTRLVAHGRRPECALDGRVELVHRSSDAARATGMRLPYARRAGVAQW